MEERQSAATTKTRSGSHETNGSARSKGANREQLAQLQSSITVEAYVEIGDQAYRVRSDKSDSRTICMDVYARS